MREVEMLKLMSKSRERERVCAVF